MRNPKSWLRWFAAMAALLVALPAAAQADRPVTVTETREAYTLSNGIVTAMVSKRTGDLLSMTYKGTETVEKDSGGHSGGYWSHDTTGGKETIARVSIDPSANGGARGEVSVKGISGGIKMGHGPGTAPDGDVQLDIDIRYALGRGERGIYTYSILHHRPEYDAGFMAEARYAVKLEKFFTNIHVDGARSGKYPLLGEGIDKYVYTALQWEERVFGWTSPEKKLGWFMMNPSAEYLSGGPTKAEFLAHGTEPTVLNYWKSSHYGGANVDFAKGEDWTKVIGPIFFYVNEGATSEAMLADARAQLAREDAKWPYGWVVGGGYRHANERSEVRGRLSLKDPVLRNRFPGTLTVGLAKPTYPAQTYLGPRDIGWDTDGKHYQFWSKQVAPDGSFRIADVVPGSYTLYAYAEGVLGAFAKADVVVPEGGRPVDLGALAWAPIRKGRPLWEVGVADRSAAEFAGADRYFDPGVQLRYAGSFANGTAYRIGNSTPGKDWFFIQAPDPKGQKAEVSPFRGILGNGAATPYRILFPMKAAGKGTATLRVAITATGAPSLDISVNGQAVGALKLGRPEGAITRHQIYGKWYEVELAFDGALLWRGDNELVVTVPAGPLNAGVAYDYLRLELDEARAFAATPAAAAEASAAPAPSAPASAAAPRAPWPFAPPPVAQFRTATGPDGAPQLLARNWRGAAGETDLAPLAGTGGTLADWAVSRDGRRVALGIAGADGFQTVSVLDADAGLLADRLRWVKDSRLQWTPDGRALFYSGYGEPPTDPFLKEFGVHHALYRHRIGAEQDADDPVYFSDRARTTHRAALTEDGHWLVVTSSLPAEAGDSVTIIDATVDKPGPWQPVATNVDRWRFAGARGATFYFVTDAGAPHRRIVAFDLAGNANLPREIVAEAADPLVAAWQSGDRLVLEYRRGAQTIRREVPLAS